MRTFLASLLILAVGSAAADVVELDKNGNPCRIVEKATIIRADLEYVVDSACNIMCQRPQVPTPVYAVTVRMQDGEHTIFIREKVRVGDQLSIMTFDCHQRKLPHTPYIR